MLLLPKRRGYPAQEFSSVADESGNAEIRE
jgi:hypothetical protein